MIRKDSTAVTFISPRHHPLGLLAGQRTSNGIVTCHMPQLVIYAASLILTVPEIDRRRRI